MIFQLITRYRAMCQQGILGMNRRNSDYILRLNPRHFYPNVDNKLRTKKLVLSAGLPSPKLKGIVNYYGQLKELPELLLNLKSFAIKPAHGSGGDGILIIEDSSNGRFRKVNKELISKDELLYHVSNILSGMYSLGGHPDQAIIEERVVFDSTFEKISYQGVPDIRVIVCLGFPVMSMIRLPTRLSSGKANLHQGAIGAGINLSTGKTMSAVFHNSIVFEHPDTGHQLANIQIPYWNKLLLYAARCYEFTKLGYIGVDLVIDKYNGPQILEINARPGLAIQLANMSSLLPRLRQIESHASKQLPPHERVNYSIKTFSTNDS